MSSNEEDRDPTQVTLSDFIETLSDEYLEYKPTESTRLRNVIVHDEDDNMGTDISKTITVILKAVTHRGTQTLIQCDPDVSKENFINTIINMKI